VKLRMLLANADVLIHELSPAKARAASLDDDSLADLNPRLIVCSVLAWPANHPDADRPVDELLAMARLGICDEQMPMTREGPVYIRFPLGTWGAVYLAASGILARLLVRLRTGRGGPAHTSLVQGALVPMGMHWARAEKPSQALAAGMPKRSRGSQTTLFECSDGVWILQGADGWIALALRDKTVISTACAAIGATSAERMSAAVADRRVGELIAAFERAGVPVEVVREQQRDPFFDDPANRAAGLVAEYRLGSVLAGASRYHLPEAS
jgi:crotonobetainyl-CoA:carnitine CoA-transferase CaiB-like acyl-CoA transferase